MKIKGLVRTLQVLSFQLAPHFMESRDGWVLVGGLLAPGLEHTYVYASKHKYECLTMLLRDSLTLFGIMAGAIREVTDEELKKWIDHAVHTSGEDLLEQWKDRIE